MCEEWMCSAALGYTSIAEGSAADDEGMTWHSRGGVFESHNLAVENAAREHAQASSSGGGGGEGGGGGSTLVALGTPWRAECSTYLVTPPSGDAVVAGGGAVAASDGRNNEGRSDEARNDEGRADAPRPCCPHCRSPLRPAVVMFGDTDELLLRRQATAAAAYQTWEEAMEVAVSEDARRALAVIEIGCGGRVPSVRRECEDVVRDTISRGGRAVLIRINPEAHDGELPAATNGAEEVDGEEASALPLAAENVLLIRDTALRGLIRLARAAAAVGAGPGGDDGSG